jgi:hypothetical protein
VIVRLTALCRDAVSLPVAGDFPHPHALHHHRNGELTFLEMLCEVMRSDRSAPGPRGRETSLRWSARRIPVQLEDFTLK